MTKTERDELEQVEVYLELAWKYYQESSPIVQRFLKYGGWIAFQFWIIRAPLTWWMVSVIPDKVNLLIHTVPDYIVADFIAGLILAVAGFFVSEYQIWGHGGVQDED
jgi:hypothetical protein